MKRMIQTAMMFFMILAIAGCGGGGSPPTVVSPTIVTKIFSNQALDGDIVQDFSGARRVTQGMSLSPFGVQSVFAGIDPVSGEEFRAFLDFSLASVPLNAVIVSAFLDITIDSIAILPAANSIPILVELVFFQPPTLLASDFDRAFLLPLARVTFPVFRTDAVAGRHVLVDVTSLLAEAQFRAMDNFQIRILEGLGFVSPGLIEINDTTGVDRGVLAPLLEVTYF